MTKLFAEWFWVDRWEGSSAMLLPLEARGGYREMLSQAWRRGARLPNDETAIQRAIRCTTEEWERVWPLIKPYWRVDGEWLVNDTQLEIYNDAVGRAERASARGLRGAQARAQALAQAGAQAPAQADGRADAQAPAQPPPDDQLELKPPSPSLSLEQRSNGKQRNVASPDGDRDQSVFPDTPVGRSKRRDGPSVSEVWEIYKRILGRTDRLVLGGKRRRKIQERLAEGRTLADFEAAFRGCAGSDFHVAGHHTDVELICRDEAHFERFMALSRKGPTLSAKSRATRSAIAEFLKGGEDDLEKGPR